MLRNPDVYTKQPDIAAAIMVCDAFQPQIQAILCNYEAAATAHELNISEAAGESKNNCECRDALWTPNDACFNKDGHLPRSKLRWPYLRKIVKRGKKFRLECDMDTVFTELRHSLDCHVT